MNRCHVLSCLLSLAAVGCAGSGGDDPNVGTAVLELKQAPPTVQCVNAYVYYGATNLLFQIPVTPGVTTSFTLTGLPIGGDTFYLRGYNVACSQTATANFTWETDSPVYNVAADPPVIVSLKFRPPGSSGRADVSIDFPQAHGSISEVPGPSGMSSIAAGPDGNFWVTVAGGIYRITPAGVSTIVNLSNRFARVRQVVAGPDGAMWYADDQNQVGIARVDTSGGSQRFYLPSTGPTALTIGLDGNIWFTLPTNNRIGRMALDGTETEFTIPTASSTPTAITAGSDGNVWFTENNMNKIGRVTPTGVITEFPLTAGSGPDTITAGPDGNVWFTEVNVGRIGRITPAGVVTEFTVPSHDNFVTAIARGIDGQLWFTEGGNGNIGKVTTAGVFSELLLPNAMCYATSFVGGSDGAMWFTESCSRLGRMVP